jgi:glutaminyl-tRNA synthetase
MIDVGLLEYMIREDLNKKANRYMGVLDPLKVVITNYPEDKTEEFDAKNNPEDETAGTRKVSFSNTIYIERDDFMEDAPNKFFRLKPGGEVRLKYAYFIKCENIIKDADGNITELHCTYDPESRGGQSPDGRKVKGTIHWVDSKTCVDAEVRLYDRLFLKEDPDDLDENETYLDYLNPDSLQIITAKIENNLADAAVGTTVQFERKGYFCVDKDSNSDKQVWNRTVGLKDSWSKIAGK